MNHESIRTNQNTPGTYQELTKTQPEPRKNQPEPISIRVLVGLLGFQMSIWTPACFRTVIP